MRDSDKGAFDDLPEDDLDAAITGPKDPTKLSANMMPAGFNENCPKCHGSGRFRSWSGRDVGACLKCSGTGKQTFKTSKDHRAKAKASSVASKARKADEALATFEAAHPELAAWWTGNSYPFAVQMRDAVRQYGDLTPRQFAAAMGAANKLIAAKAASAARVANAQVVDMSKIVAAFATASSSLKAPKLRVAGFVVSHAKATSANAGALYVKAGDLYLGKIKDGKFIPSRDCSPEQEAKIVEVANDPKGAAIAYGRLTGSCACCGRELTDPKSIELGIGPVCAEKWGF